MEPQPPPDPAAPPVEAATIDPVQGSAGTEAGGIAAAAEATSVRPTGPSTAGQGMMMPPRAPPQPAADSTGGASVPPAGSSMPQERMAVVSVADPAPAAAAPHPYPAATAVAPEPEPMEVDTTTEEAAAESVLPVETAAAAAPPPPAPTAPEPAAAEPPAPVPASAPVNTSDESTAAPTAAAAPVATTAPQAVAEVVEAEAAKGRAIEEDRKRETEEAQIAAAAAAAAVAQAAREEEEEKRKAEELERAKAQAEAEAAAAAKEEMARLQAEAAKQQAAAAAALQAATSALLSMAQVATARNLPGLSAAVNAALPTLTSAAAASSSSKSSSSGGASSSDAQSTREGILSSADKGYLPSVESITKEATKAVNDNPPYVHLSGRDTAPQLRIDENPATGRRLTLRGGMRGYRMARATHGVSSGTYYYEVLILTPAGAREVVRNLPDVVRLGDGLRENLQDDLVREVLEKEDDGVDDENASSAAAMAGKSSNKRARKSNVGTPPNYDASKLPGHVRIGWSMRTGDLQAPVGYDRWSYGFRDILGSRIHRSRREDRWGGEPFGPGDIMGLCITMIDEDEDGDASSFSAKGSGCHIRLFKNGQALGHFEIVRGAKLGGEAFNIMPGTYYPAISSYMGGSARVNFGPHFVYPPPKTLPGGWKALPVSDLCPPPPEPKDAAALAVQERNFPKKTEDSVIKAFQEAVEVEAKIRSKCYKAHYSKHAEEIRSDRLQRGLNTADLPADESAKDGEEDVPLPMEDAKMVNVG